MEPAPRLLLDDVYVYHPARILSPAARDYVNANACIATGRYTRLNVLVQQLAASPPPRADTAPVDMAAFWSIIETARDNATGHGSDFAVELTRRLWVLAPTALQQFHDLFWQNMRPLGRDVHHIVYQVRGGCSDDDFLDFRQWLIAQGQVAFQRVVDDPQVLHKWGEGGIGFAEGMISTPLHLVGQTHGVSS